MSNAITWRNIDAPNLNGAMAGMRDVSSTVNGIFSGLRSELDSQNQVIKDNWENTKTNNTNAFLAKLAEYQNPEEAQAAMASLRGELTGFGGQIDATAARSALGALVENLQRRETTRQQFVQGNDAFKKWEAEAPQVDHVTQFKSTILGANKDQLAEYAAALPAYAQSFSPAQMATLQDALKARDLGLKDEAWTAQDRKMREELHNSTLENQRNEILNRGAMLRLRQQEVQQQGEEARLRAQANGLDKATRLTEATTAAQNDFLDKNPYAKTINMASEKDIKGMSERLGIKPEVIRQRMEEYRQNPVRDKSGAYSPSLMSFEGALREHHGDWFNAQGSIRSYLNTDLTVNGNDIYASRAQYAKLTGKDGERASDDSAFNGNNAGAGKSATSPAAAAAQPPVLQTSAPTNLNQTGTDAFWAAGPTGAGQRVNLRTLEQKAQELTTKMERDQGNAAALTKQFGAKMVGQRAAIDAKNLEKLNSEIAALRSSLSSQQTAVPAAPVAPAASAPAADPIAKAANAVPPAAAGTPAKDGSIQFGQGNFLMRGGTGNTMKPVYGEGTKVKAMDGDTIHVTNGDKVTKLRLFNADTPETAKKGGKGQAFGEEAKKFINEALSSGKVEVVVSGNTSERHNRNTGEIFVNGKSLNEALISNGLASVMNVKGAGIPPAKMEQYKALEQQAMRKGLGMWGTGSIPTPAAYFRATGEELFPSN